MSKKLTPKQEKFAQNVAKGMKKTEAAKQAGALIDPSEVAESVLFILSRPRNVTIHDIVVLPTNIDA